MEDPEAPFITIDELSRRVGVSEFLLRAWELRYGLINPARMEGDIGLYAIDDEVRILSMLAYIAQGLSPELAAQASITNFVVENSEVSKANSEKMNFDKAYLLLRDSLDNFEEAAAQMILDGFFADFSLENVFRDVLLPYLHEMGIRWEQESLSVGQEHFASNIFRGRLSELARGWADGDGPTAILACPPGEIHEFALMMAGIMLHRSGWRIRYLGSNTPIGVVIDLVEKIRPELVLLSSTATKRFSSIISELRQISALAPLAIAGRGASQELADDCGATLIVGDSVSSPLEIAKIIV